MDGQRFDAWSSALATERRTALRLAVGGALGVALARFGLGEAAAACRKPGQACQKNKHTCCGGAKCKGGKCRCKKNVVACDKKCCKPGQVCVDGLYCENGPLESGDFCNPDKPFACESGTCSCISDPHIGTQCTCRDMVCRPLGTLCVGTNNCCEGGCTIENRCQLIG